MGYYSDFCLVVRKEILVEHLITPTIPALLLEHGHQEFQIDRVACIGWYVENWKFYNDFPEIQAIYHFMKELDRREPPYTALDLGWYGAIRMGEDHEDVDSFGNPYGFGISIHREIAKPF